MEPVANIWKHYNVHLAWPDAHSEKICVTALSKDDALKDTRTQRAIEAGAYPVKVIGPLGAKPSTPKQKIAQHYGYLMGSIKGAKLTFKNAMRNTAANEKLSRASSLVETQFSKLERDLRDCFKLAGLNIK